MLFLQWHKIDDTAGNLEAVFIKANCKLPVYICLYAQICPTRNHLKHKHLRTQTKKIACEDKKKWGKVVECGGKLLNLQTKTK